MPKPLAYIEENSITLNMLARDSTSNHGRWGVGGRVVTDPDLLNQSGMEVGPRKLHFDDS